MLLSRALLDRPLRSAPRWGLHKPFHPTDYRSVIASALQVKPFDEESVHDCVCTYVRAERDRGRTSSDVIVALTELVEHKGLTSGSVRHALTRQVIPWCVAAYFGPRVERSVI